MPLEPDVPPELLRLLTEENDRQMNVLTRLLERWPNFRGHIASYQLGAAIGLADMMGEDVEGFIAHLRAQVPKPSPIAPGPRSAS